MVWFLALCPDDAKHNSVVYGVEFGVVFLVTGSHSASIQEGLDCVGLYYLGFEEERYFGLVVELKKVPPDTHPACAGLPGDFNGHVLGFDHGAP